MSFRKSRSAAVAVAVGGLLVGVVGVAAPAGAAGHVVSPGQSIQDAINGSSPGDTIIVKPGVYNENLDVTVDGITLIGFGATLEPPASAVPTACSNGDPGTDGICVAGIADPTTGDLAELRRDVKIIGMRITGFEGLGISAFGASGLQLIRNTLTDNGGYGAAAFSSTGTVMIANHASGSEEAGLYIGDSPDANATLIGNAVSDNQEGIFQRNAENVRMVGNRSTGNCIGILVLADAPGPAGNSQLYGNIVKDNTRVCPPSEDVPAPISGAGVVLFGAHDVSVRANLITGNVAAVPDSLVPGGVVVTSGFGGTAAANNVVKGNFIVGNAPDISWDGAGAGNVFTHNLCQTSDPGGLC